MRAAVDVMGGDRAPDEILKGCFEAAPLLDGNDLILDIDLLLFDRLNFIYRHDVGFVNPNEAMWW